jgi:hypothetical protein
MGSGTGNVQTAKERGVGKTKVVSGGTTVRNDVQPKRVQNGKG